ncbi:TIGR01548 family HAD-type hydrolase [Tumidithrix helvetica PCC 7403]|uniref:TIGR01548 family HAD-type hydrolase n=1 Tax=Tumidithrix helvetica TaxID=3457545 RepID=UPI003C93BF55
MIDLSKVALVLDIDGVIRDVAGSYRRALADTVEHFTHQAYRPTPQQIDDLKAEGIWNNDWEAAQELTRRYFAAEAKGGEAVSYEAIVQFFQSRYRGDDPVHWNGYISQEPLIATPEYFQTLTTAKIAWGFFSGATLGSASYVLRRLEIQDPVLVAMEDAPGKPDPTGLFMAIARLEHHHTKLDFVIYAGDTVADMLTIQKARQIATNGQHFMAVGVIPPHVQDPQRQAYTDLLKAHGADLVLENILALTPEAIAQQINMAVGS